ncbi:MAG: large conductance mechanosensitive channel protein MscL [Bifidobacterium sp.]|jgi:large conductance mechanosensitive channel|nr:large conductance mechanosensitive channel protein MscL [Bifidobacterium sp.]
MLDGFKKFIARGNMIDMAVGVVMGAAVTAVVTAIVKNVINPLIAMIFGSENMDGLLAFTVNKSTVSFGAVLGALINFLVVAAAVYFCIVLPINKFRDMAAARHGVQEEEAATLSPEEQTVALLQEIRDELAKGGDGKTVIMK